MRPAESIVRWRIAVLVSTAIAISYLDRQTLPVAIQAISRDVPLSNEQFSTLQSAFLFAYALMYAGGERLVDMLGTRLGLTAIMLLNSPMAEYFPRVDVEVGNELFWYIFRGEPSAKGGSIDLDDNVPGLGLTIDEAGLERFEVFE